MGRREAALGLLYLPLVTLTPFSTMALARSDSVLAAIWLYCADLGHIGLPAAALAHHAETGDDARRRATLSSPLLLAASAAIAAGLSFVTPGHCLWAFALNAFSPYLRRRAGG